MLGILLLGFAPVPDGVQNGPDAPHLADDLPIQLELSTGDPRLGDLREAFGWQWVRWDQDRRVPRSIAGAAVPESRAVEYAAAIARLAGIEPADLKPLPPIARGRRTGIGFAETVRGAEVEGARLDLYSVDGRISLALSSLAPVAPAGDPRPGERALALPDGTAAWVTRSEDGFYTVFRDRSGAVVHRWDNRRWLDVTHPERTAGDPLVSDPARDVRVSDGSGFAYTADDGSNPYAGTLFDASFQGLNVQVSDNYDPVSVLGVDDDVLDAGADVLASVAQTSVAVHTVRDWISLRDPTNPWPAAVCWAADEVTGTCNAYYWADTVNFYEAGDGCVSMGQIADVVYHEYGHGIHENGLQGGVWASDVSEGSADYVAATINDDPYVAIGWQGPGSYIREIATDKVYPRDLSGEPHNDGLVWASFWWDVHEQEVADLGYDPGIEKSDLMFLAALSMGPALTDAGDVTLNADDDDGDLSNGTPDACVLIPLLHRHGLYPGPLALLEATPVPDQPSDDGDVNLAFSLPIGSDCPSVLDGMHVWYTLDPPDGVPLGSLSFTEAALTRTDQDFVAVIPDQPTGTRVGYYFEWTDGVDDEVTTDGSSSSLWSYWVGDQAPLWCDDFESGDGQWTFTADTFAGVGNPGWASDWAVGAPTGSGTDPSAPFAGASVLGTGLSGGGHPNNAEYAQGPALDLTPLGNRSILKVDYARWLGLAAGDVAEVALRQGVDTVLWESPDSTAISDNAWRLVSHDVRGLHDGGPASVAFDLMTDANNTLGGWNLDQVCVTTLAEPERHYRVQDLAVDGGQLTFTAPYVKPLAALRVVRADHLPTGPDDGVDLADLADPTPGASLAATDDSPPSAEEYAVYAVFAAEADGAFYTDAVLGENAVAVGTPPATGGTTGGTTGTTGSTGPGTADGPGDGPPVLVAQGGCGCDGGPSTPIGPLAFLLAGLATRRRKAAGRAAARGQVYSLLG